MIRGSKEPPSTGRRANPSAVADVTRKPVGHDILAILLLHLPIGPMVLFFTCSPYALLASVCGVIHRLTIDTLDLAPESPIRSLSSRGTRSNLDTMTYHHGPG